MLPLGTANLFARDLGILLDLDGAIAAFSGMEPKTTDVGELNGRVFLHKVVVELPPAVAAGRERIRKRGGLSTAVGSIRIIRQFMCPHDLPLTLDAAEEESIFSRCPPT